MRLLLDGSIFERPATGVAKATLGLYRACLATGECPPLTMLHRRPLVIPAPAGMVLRQLGSPLPDRLWRHALIPAGLAFSAPAFVHFPWNGAIPALPARHRAVMSLYDVLPLTIPGYFAGSRQEQAYRRRVQRDLDRAALVVTCSEFSRQEIGKHFRIHREPVVIPLAATLSPTGHETAPGNYYLYVGGYDPRKGIEQLIATFLALHRHGGLLAPLLLVGTPRYYSEALGRLVAVAKATGAIQERGYLPDDELAALYAGARALVYPSKYEGFGLPPLEAMALGCPVITTRGTSLPEVCKDAALYADPDDERELASAILALEEDEALRHMLSAKGRERAAAFSWEHAAERFLLALQGLRR